MPISSCRFQISCPSTSANLGPGFDCLGVALVQRNVWDITVLGGGRPGRCELVETSGGGALEEIPTDTEHLFFASWKRLHEMGLGPDLFQMLKEHGLEVELRAHNETPISRGLGSSAALRVASAEVYRRLTDGERPAWELAAQLEGHPDNAAPAGLGGLVLGTRDQEGRFRVIQLPMHDCWQVAVAIPNFALRTDLARAALPDYLSRGDAIFNMGRLAFLLEGLKTGDAEVVALGCQDRMHQHQRAELVPGLESVMRAATSAGAAASYLSGAGPTVAAFVDSRNGEAPGPKVAEAMGKAFAVAGIDAECDVKRVDMNGLQVLEVCPL